MKYLDKYESVRGDYEKHGVDDYYKNFSDQYDNPHSQYIYEIIDEIFNSGLVDFTKCLDLSCGDGLITQILVNKGVMNVKGLDPYMCKEYEEETKKKCLKLSFKDIQSGKLSESFSTIFCSYGLHLCESSILPDVLWNLSLISEFLVIISPNNRPIITENNGWKHIYNMKKGKSKCKIYVSKNL